MRIFAKRFQHENKIIITFLKPLKIMKKIFFATLLAIVMSALCLTSCHKASYPSTAEVFKDAVTDYDGNTYDAVKIGDQVWMASNLKTKHFADGTEIPESKTTDLTSAMRYKPKCSNSQLNDFGYLYNWKAAVNGKEISATSTEKVQGACPNGWHIPTLTEWKNLISYLESDTRYRSGDSCANIGKALASQSHWKSCATAHTVGNRPASNNATGFTAMPAGTYFGTSFSTGEYAYFWSATPYDSTYAYGTYLFYRFTMQLPVLPIKAMDFRYAA